MGMWICSKELRNIYIDGIFSGLRKIDLEPDLLVCFSRSDGHSTTNLEKQTHDDIMFLEWIRWGFHCFIRLRLGIKK